uniref:Uncharacterized protein n=1 Tax=Arundo donax TaxID=35708 RepID=A0A0A9CHW8_ARUDO
MVVRLLVRRPWPNPGPPFFRPRPAGPSPAAGNPTTPLWPGEATANPPLAG